MATIREYKVSHTIPLEHANYQPNTIISAEEYNGLGVYQDRVAISEREVPGEILENELAEYPQSEIVETQEAPTIEEVQTPTTEVEAPAEENTSEATQDPEETPDLENARAEYFALFGEKPHHAKGLTTILEEIAQEKDSSIN
jgi:hypothetical protein